MSVWDWIWATPDKPVGNERASEQRQMLDHAERVHRLSVQANPELLLDVARRIQEDESGRKSSAETRATTYITAVAALIPLLTWAVGSRPSCMDGVGCWAQVCLFVWAVIYMVMAAHWSLRTLAPAAYHCVNVEDVLKICEANEELSTALIREILLAARKNRDTINRKLTYVMVAQRHLFNAVLLQGVLLILHPVTKLAWPAAIATGNVACS